MLTKSDLIEYKHKIKDHKPLEEQRLITDLVAELAIVFNDKANLESENATFKLECQELKYKLIDFERIANEEKNRLMENVKKWEETIQEKEINLAKKDVQHLEEQKKYLMELNNLKTAYYKQKGLFEQREMELKNKITSLKEKTLEANNNFNVMHEMANSFKNKYEKYKAKLKYAIEIINNLTAMLKTCEQQKQNMFNIENQTETVNKCVHEDHTSLCSMHSQCAIKTENIVLGELFFKQHPFNDEIETLFFMPSNKSAENF